jgi:hypothetical protein
MRRFLITHDLYLITFDAIDLVMRCGYIPRGAFLGYNGG